MSLSPGGSAAYRPPLQKLDAVVVVAHYSQIERGLPSHLRAQTEASAAITVAYRITCQCVNHRTHSIPERVMRAMQYPLRVCTVDSIDIGIDFAALAA